MTSCTFRNLIEGCFLDAHPLAFMFGALLFFVGAVLVPGMFISLVGGLFVIAHKEKKIGPDIKRDIDNGTP